MVDPTGVGDAVHQGMMAGVALVPAFLVACALLVVAGIAKMRAPASARASLALVGVPVSPVAIRALGAAELVLGVFAVFRPGALSAGLVAGAYGAFALTALRLFTVDKSADCGCFGAASSVTSRAHAVTCVVACAVAAVAAAFTPPGVSWIASRSPLVAGTLVLGTATAVFAAYAVFTLFAPAWRSYGSRSPA